MASTRRLTDHALRWLRTLTFRPQRLGTFSRYTIALATVFLGLVARLALEPVWQARLPYITLFPAIMLSAGFGGFGPGLTTTLLTALGAAYFWVLPERSLRITDSGELAGVVVFVAVGAVISGLNEAWRRGTFALVASEQRLAVTLASIGDGVLTTDDKGSITSMNDVAEHITGWPSRDAIGRPVEDVVVLASEDSGTPLPNPVRQVLQTGKPLTSMATSFSSPVTAAACRSTTASRRSGSGTSRPPVR